FPARGRRQSDPLANFGYRQRSVLLHNSENFPVDGIHSLLVLLPSTNIPYLMVTREYNSYFTPTSVIAEKNILFQAQSSASQRGCRTKACHENVIPVSPARRPATPWRRHSVQRRACRLGGGSARRTARECGMA